MEEIKNETTNAVLGVKMDSFKDLVDTKFKNVEQTLERIEKSNYMTVTAFNDRAKEQDVKIELLMTDKANMQGSINTLKVLGVIVGLLTPVATIIATHYWK